MEKKEMSQRLREKIGEYLHTLTGEELTIFLDYEIQECEKDEKGSYVGLPGRCDSANILVAEALRRSNEDYKSYLTKRGHTETEPGKWYNRRYEKGFTFP